MKREVAFLLFASLVLVAALVVRLVPDASAVSEEPVKVVVYVKDSAHKPAFRGFGVASAAVSSESVLRSIPSREVSGKRRFSSFDGFAATVSRSEFERLRSNPNIEVFVDSGDYRVLLDGSGPVLNATVAHGLVFNGSNLTGSTVGVCVIDTGVNYSHPALGGCTSSEFLSGTCAKVPAGYDFVGGDADPYDDHGHGSHVAGIVASTDSVYRGIAPNASIIAVKVCNSGGSCGSGDMVSGIDWCINNASRLNISVITLSIGTSAVFGSYCDDDPSQGVFRRPIDNATVMNISVTIASGNAGSTSGISSPACIRNATAVGSTTKADAVSSFSNRNNITDLLAPGTDIVSVNWPGGFTSLSGTSMATPHVAGAIALLAQFNKLSKGLLNISPPGAFLALNTTGANITDLGGSGIKFARIDAYRAILFSDSAAPNLTYAAPTLGNNSNSSSVNVFVNVSSSEILHSALLEWNNVTHVVNYSMVQNGSGLYWARNHSSGSSGVITYRVWGNDSSGNIGVTPIQTVQVNNSPPRIDAFQPSGILVNVAEPSPVLFNVTYSDTENDVVIVDWYVNQTIQSSARNTNFTFAGNYTQASQLGNGTYNVTAVVSDGGLSVQLNWTVTVNNTNRAPAWAGFANQTVPEDSLVNFTVTAADLDNESISYFINNTFNFTIQSNGNVTFNLSNAGNFSGIFYLAINASDGLANASEFIFVNITPVNDTPTLHLIANVTVNETDFVNVTVVADDAEGDILNFTINDTGRFNLNTSNRSAANFSWKANLSDSGVYQFSVNVTDFNTSSLRHFNVTVIDRSDFDGDGTPDIYDVDDDNDGALDGDDSVIGNSTSINSSTLQASSLGVAINGSANASRLLAESLLVNISNGSRSLVQFFWNFSLSNLSFNFTIDVQNSTAPFGGIIVRGLRLQNSTKNVTFAKVNNTINSTCIKDAEVSSFSNISFSCDGANETFLSCPGSSGGHSCSFVDGAYLITNVSFTAVREQCADADLDGVYASGCGSGTDCDDADASKAADCSSVQQNSNSGGGGGGGGGGGSGGSGGSASKALQVFAAVGAGETAAMRINRSGIAFTRVSFTAAVPLSGVNVDVEPLNESRVDALLDMQVYQYLSVSTKLTYADISSASVEFRVPRQWLSDGGFKASDVALFRHSGGSWDEMATAVVSEDGKYVFYSASLPAFSLFAVAARKAPPVKPAHAVVDLPVVVSNFTEVNVSQPPVVVGQPFYQEVLESRNVKLAVAAFSVSILVAALLLWNRLREKEKLVDFLSRFSGLKFRKARK